MDRYAIFVDAGYFFAAGAEAAFVNKTPRKQVVLKSPRVMLEDLCVRASATASNLSLLRIYWYDAMPGPRLSMEQSALAMLPGIKLRLGALNNAGEQKGVDSLIVTDLIELARNRAIADAVVVTGDEDLRIAVQVAQSFGVRVHILAAGDPSKNVSPSLQMESDSVATLDATWFLSHLELLSAVQKVETAQSSTPKLPASGIMPGMDDVANAVIREILEGVTSEQLTQLVQHFSTQKTVPPEYDRPMIAKVSAELSCKCFSKDEMRHIRGLFVRAVRARSSDSVKAQ